MSLDFPTIAVLACIGFGIWEAVATRHQRAALVKRALATRRAGNHQTR